MNLVTIKNLSEYLQVKPSTLYSWVHNGTIPFHKLNGLVRFDLEEIETWVKSLKYDTRIPDIAPHKTAGQGIDGIIKKAIDSAKGKGYNSSNGKPGQMQGLSKEV
jgi:excisionase family DNA binding protein